MILDLVRVCVLGKVLLENEIKTSKDTDGNEEPPLLEIEERISL